ncbi:MAG: hypothetical protein K6B28_01095 [Lachnospiraceae bacterium]|nr:hypothetical protein [Lachnospiraceae bacterium]
MNIKDTDPLTITDKGTGRKYYGGDQAWFKENTRAYGGCGVVAGTNMLRTILLKDDSIEVKGEELKKLKDTEVTKDDYIRVMNNMYKKMMVFEVPIINRIYNAVKRNAKWTKIIIPSFGMSQGTFIRGLLSYAKENGILLHSHILTTTYCSYDKALEFIKEGLSDCGAVTILTSFNRHPLKLYSNEEDKKTSESSMRSHFATVTEILYNDKNEPVLKMSTWGRMATVSYKELYHTWQKRRAYSSTLFYFTKAASNAVYRADIRNSAMTILRSVKQTLLKKA